MNRSICEGRLAGLDESRLFNRDVAEKLFIEFHLEIKRREQSASFAVPGSGFLVILDFPSDLRSFQLFSSNNSEIDQSE